MTAGPRRCACGAPMLPESQWCTAGHADVDVVWMTVAEHEQATAQLERIAHEQREHPARVVITDQMVDRAWRAFESDGNRRGQAYWNTRASIQAALEAALGQEEHDG